MEEELLCSVTVSEHSDGFLQEKKSPKKKVKVVSCPNKKRARVERMSL